MDNIESAAGLLEKILSAAESRGIRESDLAKNAGLTPEGLSKAKQRGDLRFSTLARLAKQVDLYIVLEPYDSGRGPLIQRLKAGKALALDR